jgi:hypothetical protein
LRACRSRSAPAPVTPVVYLYLDRLQTWLRGKKRDRAAADEKVRSIAAE